jgi:uncharacterized membrane protein
MNANTGTGNIAMQANKVSADEGWVWYASGWKFFIRDPGVQIVYLLIILLISIGLALVPLVGGLVLVLITPVLAGGWFHALHELDSGHDIGIGTLFEGFGNRVWTGPLIVLGVLMLAAEFLIGIVGITAMSGSVLGYMETMQAAEMPPLPGLGMLIGLFIILVLSALFFMALFYAVPLIQFQGAAPLAAMQSSFSASLQNIGALTVFGLVYLVLAFFAAIPFALGFLVLVPVSVAAAYNSYKSVYGVVP